MNFKRRLMPLTLGALLITGCAGQPGGQKASTAGGNGEVNIAVTIQQQELSDATIAEFEAANPGIKVTKTTVDASKLISLIAAGNAPDIIRISGIQLPSYVTRGLALNLQDRIEASEIIDQNDFLPVVDIYKWDGTQTGKGPLYGLPKDWSLDQTFFINKTHFEKHNIPLPDDKTPMTFEQMAAYSAQLFEESGGQTNVFGSCGWDISFTISTVQTYLEQHGKTLWSDDYKKINLNNDDVKQIFNMINKNIQSRTVASVVNPAQGDYPGVFSEGKAAMFQAGYWFSGQLRQGDMTKNRLDDYMMLPAIQTEGGQRLSACTGATGAIILNGTKHPDEAFKFFEYFFAGKPADDRAKIGFGLPIFKSKMDLLPRETDFDKQVYAVTMDEIENTSKVFIQLNPFIESEALNAALERELAPVYFGRESLEVALPRLEKEIQTLIDEGIHAAQAVN